MLARELAAPAAVPSVEVAQILVVGAAIMTDVAYRMRDRAGLVTALRKQSRAVAVLEAAERALDLEPESMAGSG